ncbi:MAG: hypothetical protein CMO44_17755 [Verrucomicrobiales bacterium]|nr:hypothetical protein [Verrucomicrobiales bacterium]|tara:strand:+ start:8981 stop:9343 length:363 start_codon:yes stop_codon:yes gene_type:complete
MKSGIGDYSLLPEEEYKVLHILKIFSEKTIVLSGNICKLEGRDEISENDIVRAMQQFALPTSGFWQNMETPLDDLIHATPMPLHELNSRWNEWIPDKTTDELGFLVRIKVDELKKNIEFK